MVEKNFVWLLALYPILMVLERFIPGIGGLSTLFTIIFLIFMLMKKGKNKVIKYIIIFAVLVVGTIKSQNLQIHFEHLAYLCLFLFILDFSTDRTLIGLVNKYISEDKYKKILYYLILFIFIFNILCIFTQFGYSKTYSEAWGIKAYRGIFADPHQAAYRMSGILLICLFFTKFEEYKKKTLIISLGYLALVLMTGARVPTLLSIVIEFLIIRKQKIKFIVNKLSSGEKIASIIMLVAIISIIFIGIIGILKTSNFGQKIILSIESGGFDNGRENLEKVDVEYFKSFNIKDKLFGIGNEKTNELHIKIFNNNIWTHNDYTQILIGEGCIILIIYLFNVIKLRKIECNTLFQKYLFIFTLLFVAWKNGLYIHPRFTIAVIFYALTYIPNNNLIGEKNEK